MFHLIETSIVVVVIGVSCQFLYTSVLNYKNLTNAREECDALQVMIEKVLKADPKTVAVVNPSNDSSFKYEAGSFKLCLDKTRLATLELVYDTRGNLVKVNPIKVKKVLHCP